MLQKPHIPASFNMYLVINKWVTAVKVSNFSGHYLRNNWTLDIGVLGYIGIVWPKEHSPEVWSVPPITPCISKTGSIELTRRLLSRKNFTLNIRLNDKIKHKVWLVYRMLPSKWWVIVSNFIPYPTAFPYGNGMVLHFYQQQESSTTKTVHKVINKGLKTYV